MNDAQSNASLLEVAPGESATRNGVTAPPAAKPASRSSRFLSWLVGAMLNVLVLAALGAVVWWGQQTGWTVPKFSDLFGNGSTHKDDWCSEHAVPESECVECNPDLMPRGKEHGWCPKHGVSECPLCHPEVAQLPSPPTVTPADLERAKQAMQAAERTPNNFKCTKHHRRLQFVSAEAVDRFGVAVAPVHRAEAAEWVTANGEIQYDPTLVAQVNARVPGRVWRVLKRVGEPVARGEVMALVDAAEVGRAKSELRQAFDQVSYLTRKVEDMQRASGAIPERQILDAQASLREARVRLAAAEQVLANLGLPLRGGELQSLSPAQLAQRLQVLGLPDAVTRQLDAAANLANLLPVLAPLDGVVVEREVVDGEEVDTKDDLLVVADVRRMWLTLTVRLEDAETLIKGQKVFFRPDGGKDEVGGSVRWISSAVDEATRTVQVRADLPNADGRLRANTFGTSRIIVREEQGAIEVPSEAIHWEGCCHVVFVRDKNFLQEGAPKVFHVRKVLPGAKDGTNTEVIAGVLPGELVAARGSGLLRTELLKNDLGEG